LIINELETNPGRWARIGEFPRPSTAGAVKFRLAKTYTPPRWELTARRTPTGSTLYMRYRKSS
jgi:hypothetical protein